MKIKIIAIVFFILFCSQMVFGEENNRTVKVNHFLKLGPMKMTPLELKNFGNDRERANQSYIDERFQKPAPDDRVEWRNGEIHKWKKTTKMIVTNSGSSITYFAVYLDVFRRIEANLFVKNMGDLMIDIYLDGISLKKSFNSKDRSLRAKMDLLNEKHILFIKVFSPNNKKSIPELIIEIPEFQRKPLLDFSLNSDRRVNFRNILNMTSVRKINVSPYGKYAALSLAKMNRFEKTVKWKEIIETNWGKTVLNTELIGNVSNFRWTNRRGIFSFTVTRKNRTSLNTFDINKMKTGTLIRELKNLSDYEWSPDNRFMIILKYKKRDLGKGFKYIRDIPDRTAYNKYEYSLEIFYPEGGVRHTIGDEGNNYSGFLISPDSKKVLITRETPDTKKRPYFSSEFFILSLGDFSIKKLFKSNFVRPLSWSPDSKKILFTGGPSSFNGVGRSPALDKDTIPNEYDSQLFIYIISSGIARPITKFFAPSVSSAFWNKKDGNIYIKGQDRSFVKLYRYDLKKKKFRKYRTHGDVIGAINMAENGAATVFWESGSTLPHKLYKINVRSGRVTLLRDLNREDFRGVKFGKIENWNFRKKNNEQITGRIYYPANFSPKEKYPCIVYYYGGTSPVERSFGGRYPFNWYAANGYIVYVLQPSGATGFGQKFSSRHVNDWGRITSNEIISAVKEMLRRHPWIDPSRVGAMGASYGGFLTQYLATRTDIFSAFISHAGISALSSYWGVGDWGYSYSGYATANSFPWNRKDIYVGHSPLFMADRIKDPILLLHGDADNNVPPGESYQMFLALKILGKEVSLVTFGGQAHWILEYGKRIRWMKTIIAWFDKWLKNEPLYWNKLYGKYKKEPGVKN